MNESRSRVIRSGRIENDNWLGFAAVDAFPPGGSVFVDQPGWVLPLPLWKACRARLSGRRHPPAVWLDAGTDPATLLEDGRLIFPPDDIAFIAIDFSGHADRRGHALARALRDRHGWQGELRAVGDVRVETVHALSQAGFDSFTIRPGHDPLQALAALEGCPPVCGPGPRRT